MRAAIHAIGSPTRSLVLASSLGWRDGFNDAVKQHADLIQLGAQVPTEWNQEKAIAGGIDLSASSTIGLTSVIDTLVMNSDSGLLGGSQWAATGGAGAVEDFLAD